MSTLYAILRLATEKMEERNLDEMKKRLKEMEEEATTLREMQAKVEKEMGAVQDEMKKQLKEMEEEATALREMQAKVEKEMGVVQGSKILYLFFRFL
ncbi:polyadenylate-binding protein 3 [Quercus suber]|uniref:Polyadenylate-binding protein 3 n=1 Tax=Quercus suber TaxID=58331 RepID=A0AAW0L283_QUESU